jgi:hypothetical protein
MMQYSGDCKVRNSHDKGSNSKSINENSSTTCTTISFSPCPKCLAQETDLTGVPGLEAGLVDDKEPIYFVIL